MKKRVSILLSATLLLSGAFSSAAMANEGRKEKFNAEIENCIISDTFDVPVYIKGKLTDFSKDNPEKIVKDYFGKQNAKSDLIVVKKFKNEQNKSVIKTRQAYKGIRIKGADQSYIVGEDGVIESISGISIPDIENRLKGSIVLSEDGARSVVEKDLGRALKDAKHSSIEKIILPQNNEAVYAYSIKLSFYNPFLEAWEYTVNAEDGKIINKQNILMNQSVPVEGTGIFGDTRKMTGHYGEIEGFDISPDRPYTLVDLTKTPPEGAVQKPAGIFTYKYDENKDVRLADDDNGYFTDDVSQAHEVDAHYFASKVYDFYKEVFGRNSYDNLGSDIKIYTHSTVSGVNNACWDPVSGEMHIGDGDGEEFYGFAGEADTIGHEFTHGVVMSEADIEYNGQFGAINEALADFFGEVFESYVYNREPDWAKLVECYTPKIPGDVMIDMKNPGLTKISGTERSYPDHMDGFYIGGKDANGVHINASILTKAFSLISDGGEFHNVKVPAIGIDKLSKIMYKVITEYLTPQTTFNELAIISQEAAAELYTKVSTEYNSIRAGFQAVGILSNTLQWNIYSESEFKTSAGSSAAMMIGDRAYAVGGFDINSLDMLDGVWEYSFPKNTWVKKNPLPKNRGFLNLASTNGKGYALFGYEDFMNQSGFYTTVDEYDPSTDKWTTIAELPKKQLIEFGSYDSGRVIASPVEYTDNWFIVKTGEMDPGASIDIKLQKSRDNVNFVDEKAWTPISAASTTTELIFGFSDNEYPYFRLIATVRGGNCSFGIESPRIRTGCSTVAYDGKIYVIGGGSLTTSFTTMDVFDTVTRQWTTDLPGPANGRYYAGTALVDNDGQPKIYVFFGGSKVVEVYDINRGAWYHNVGVSPENMDCKYCSAVEYRGKIHITGNTMVEANGATIIYDPQTNRWYQDQNVGLPNSIQTLNAVYQNNLYQIGTMNFDSLFKVERYDPVKISAFENNKNFIVKWSGFNNSPTELKINGTTVYNGTDVEYKLDSRLRSGAKNVLQVTQNHEVYGSIDSKLLCTIYQKIGDFDNNNIIDIIDKNMLERYLSGSISFNNLQILAADVNKDDKIDEKDLEILTAFAYEAVIYPTIETGYWIIYGDVDNDGEVDMKDFTRVYNYIMAGGSLTPYERFAADVNGDGEVNSIDLGLIRKYIDKDNVLFTAINK